MNLIPYNLFLSILSLLNIWIPIGMPLYGKKIHEFPFGRQKLFLLILLYPIKSTKFHIMLTGQIPYLEYAYKHK